MFHHHLLISKFDVKADSGGRESESRSNYSQYSSAVSSSPFQCASGSVTSYSTAVTSPESFSFSALVKAETVSEADGSGVFG